MNRQDVTDWRDVQAATHARTLDKIRAEAADQARADAAAQEQAQEKRQARNRDAGVMQDRTRAKADALWQMAQPTTDERTTQ